jgi:hypothetical protein
MSENSTADTSFSSRRGANNAYTPSPTKLQRKQTNFSSIGNTILNSTKSSEFKGFNMKLNKVNVIDTESEA